jgi:hypothetical protein
MMTTDDGGQAGAGDIANAESEQWKCRILFGELWRGW